MRSPWSKVGKDVHHEFQEIVVNTLRFIDMESINMDFKSSKSRVSTTRRSDAVVSPVTPLETLAEQDEKVDMSTDWKQNARPIVQQLFNQGLNPTMIIELVNEMAGNEDFEEKEMETILMGMESI